MIYGKVNGQRLHVVYDYIAANSVDHITAHFDFEGNEWDNMLVFAHFTQYGVTRTAPVDANGDISKNAHLNFQYGNLDVSLHGNILSNGEMVERITTGVCHINVDKSGCPDGEPFPDVEQSVGEDIVARAETAARIAEASVGKTAYIGENSNWFVWDVDNQEFIDTGVSADGRSRDHSQLDNLDMPDQHPIEAIVGLRDELNDKKNKYAIQKLGDHFYYIEYEDLDYESGESYCMNRFNPAQSACSSVRIGNYYGRNYDWYYDNNASFIVARKATGGKHANIGNAGGIISDNIANDGSYNKLFDYLPFVTLDGINDCGVVCNINILPELDRKGYTTGTNPGKQDVPMACLVRRILDEADSADDAIYRIQNEYNIVAPTREGLSMEMHFMIADHLKTYVVEFVDNSPVIISSFVNDKPIMTNFYLTGYDGTRATLTPYAMGIERYNILSGGYGDVYSVGDMLDLMQKVKYSLAYSTDEDPVWYSEFSGRYQTFGDLTKDSTPEEYAPILSYVRNLFINRTRDNADTWHSVHSVAYDIENQMMRMIPQESGVQYEFKLNKIGALPYIEYDRVGSLNDLDSYTHVNLVDAINEGITRGAENLELFNHTGITDTTEGSGIVMIDGKTYFRYLASDVNFKYLIPHPISGELTIKIRLVGQNGNYTSGIAVHYTDGSTLTFTPQNGVPQMLTTDSEKTVAYFTGSNDADDWVLMDLSETSVSAPLARVLYDKQDKISSSSWVTLVDISLSQDVASITATLNDDARKYRLLHFSIFGKGASEWNGYLKNSTTDNTSVNIHSLNTVFPSTDIREVHLIAIQMNDAYWIIAHRNAGYMWNSTTQYSSFVLKQEDFNEYPINQYVMNGYALAGTTIKIEGLIR